MVMVRHVVVGVKSGKVSRKLMQVSIKSCKVTMQGFVCVCYRCGNADTASGVQDCGPRADKIHT